MGGEWHPCPWLIGWSDIGLYNFGCVPSTVLQDHACLVWTGIGPIVQYSPIPGLVMQCQGRGAISPYYKPMNGIHDFQTIILH